MVKLCKLQNRFICSKTTDILLATSTLRVNVEKEILRNHFALYLNSSSKLSCASSYHLLLGN